MGDRTGRPTKRLDEGDLLALAKHSLEADETAASVPPRADAASDDDPLSDWEDTLVVATGSQSNAQPTASRTATLADPLTTQLLAEVARRTSTMEFDADGIAVAGRETREIDREALDAALRTGEKPPVPTAAHTTRRTK